MLKKILPFLCILLLCSCSPSNVVTPMLKNITFVAEVEYLNEIFICDVSVIENSTEFTVVEPEEITGLTYTINNGDITAE